MFYILKVAVTNNILIVNVFFVVVNNDYSILDIGLLLSLKIKILQPLRALKIMLESLR